MTSRSVALAFVCAALASSDGRDASAATAHREQVEAPVRTIALAVNGEALDTSTPPIVVGGRVLVPLRDVFAALGIVVTRAGSTIVGRLPNGTVTIVVGSSRATVDGRSVDLGTSVVDVRGTTYAPLPLVSSALGAQATYDQRGANVQIVSTFLGRTSGAAQQREDGGTDVQGVVSALDTNSSPPAMTVVRGGTARTISVTSEAKIWVDDVTIHAQFRSALADVRVGDAVHAILARDGRVESVFDFYRSTSGTVTAASPYAIVFANGRVVTPGGTTEITLGGAPAHLGDLLVGDAVTVRSNPESGEVRQIVASRPHGTATPQRSADAPGTVAPGTVAIASVTVSARRPLRAGERFDVTLAGTPNGRATFDIGDVLTGVAMTESAPGTYVGRFTIPERFNVTQVPVYGRLAVGSASAPRTEAAQTLSATTTPPTIGEVAPPPGQTVNNVRPSIFATFGTPTDIAIDRGSVALQVNGHDVTSSSTRSGAFVTYTPGVDLPGGAVTVVVRVADAAGNASTKTWTFAIKR